MGREQKGRCVSGVEFYGSLFYAGGLSVGVAVQCSAFHGGEESKKWLSV